MKLNRRRVRRRGREDAAAARPAVLVTYLCFAAEVLMGRRRQCPYSRGHGRQGSARQASR